MGTDWRGSVRAAAPVLLAALVVQALLGWVGARAYLANHNTLLANGRWSSTKVELERGLNGSYSFLHGLQSLAGGQLNLAAWHGFQEVLWKQEVESLRSLEFDFVLQRGGWVAAVLNRARAGGPFTAVRLSGAGASDLLEVSEQGRFLGRRSLAERRFSNDVRHHARIDIGDSLLTVSVDGEGLGSFDFESRPSQQFGFRGGLRPARVDNVVARLGDGRTIRESFDTPPGALRLTATIIAILVLLNLALLVVLTALLDLPGRQLGFYVLMINLTLLVIGVLACSFAAERSSWYPGLSRSLAEKEVYFRKGESARVKRQVAERFAALAREDLFRILFVGSSQTWGAGARRESETFVAQLEELLNAATGAPRFACINGGISAIQAPGLVPFVEQWLRAGEPDMVVINLSSNDMATELRDFDSAIRAMIESALGAGARPVLIQEPRIFPEGRLPLNHRQLELIGGDYGVPVIELQDYLRSMSRKGFLWWDKVHLTSYGQTLVARRLRDELRVLLPDP